MRYPPRLHGRRGGERERDFLGGIPVHRRQRERGAGGTREVPPGGVTPSRNFPGRGIAESRNPPERGINKISLSRDPEGRRALPFRPRSVIFFVTARIAPRGGTCQSRG